MMFLPVPLGDGTFHRWEAIVGSTLARALWIHPKIRSLVDLGMFKKALDNNPLEVKALDVFRAIS